MGLYGFRDLPSALIARQVVEERKLRPNAYTSVSMGEVPTSAPPGGASRLAKATATIPARVDDDTPGQASVQPVKYDTTTGKFVNDGAVIDVLSWVNAPSADPTQDDKLFIYVWLERGTDGHWYWTGEDCPQIDPPELTNSSGSDTVITNVWTPLTGVSLTTTLPGFYTLNFDAAFNVDIGPNTTYGIGLRYNVNGTPGNPKYIYNERGSAGLEVFNGSFLFDAVGSGTITFEAIDELDSTTTLTYNSTQSDFQLFGPQ